MTTGNPEDATEAPYPVRGTIANGVATLTASELGSMPGNAMSELVWEPPGRGEPFAEVLVDFRREDETDFGSLQRLPRTAVRAMLTGLDNDRNYFARVRTKNPIGPSVARIIRVTSTADQQPQPPPPADSNLVEAAYAQETGSVVLILATITHRELNTPLRIVNNTEAITSRGNEFVAFPFEAVLPTETDEEPGAAKASGGNFFRLNAPTAVQTLVNALGSGDRLIFALSRERVVVDTTLPAVTIDNVSQEISRAIRDLTDAPSVRLEVVLAHAPDVVERTYPTFKLRHAEWDPWAVTGDLMLDDLRTESFPPGEFSPAYFPGLF